MASSIWPRDSSEPWPRQLALWAGLLAGPLAWATLLQTNYALSYVACEQRQTWMLYLATAIALVMVAGGAAAAWWTLPSPARDTTDEHEEPDPWQVMVLRARFMALGGLAMCAFFAIVILATAIPILVLHPCTP